MVGRLTLLAVGAALALVACARPPHGDASPVATGDGTNRAPTVWSGRYMFHPHQHWLADKGAMGWFAAV